METVTFNSAGSSTGNSSGSSLPLCVDLDGTLVRGDLLFESLLSILRANILLILLVPFWLLGGRARLKQELASRASLDVSLLPYNLEVVRYIREARAAGQTTLLVTASDFKLANLVAEHLGCFDQVLASDGEINLKGANKAKALIERFGEQGFEYVGNDRADGQVWAHAAKAHVVTSSDAILRLARQATSFGQHFEPEVRNSAVLRAIRPHQWVKNFLLFIPAVMAHRILEIEIGIDLMVAFVCFCACASSVYLTNDLFDLPSDRAHHSKRKRPLAAGDLSISLGMTMALGLLLSAFLIATLLPEQFLVILGIYFLLTLGYSVVFKRFVALDIVILASLYTIRVFAGGLAVDVTVSKWLLGFSMFFFLSLACIKRFSELYLLKQQERLDTPGRGYRAEDLGQVSSFGSASGYLAVLILALYVSSPEVAQLYSNPTVLWLVCPVLLYWITRIWFLAQRGAVHEDPVVFAIKDKISYLTGLLCLLFILLAI